jgi:hypothetical protein
MTLSTLPDLFLSAIKWPVAVVALLLLPGTTLAIWELLSRLVANVEPVVFFSAGFVAYMILWRLVLRSQLAGSLFSTFEHELTHAVFAWCTLHWVTGFRATWNSGGEVRYTGRGNWLISIAPYWFPTLCIPIMGLMVIGTVKDVELMSSILGATMAYHVASTWRETHSDQPDLQETGFLFAWMFLPTANLVALAAVLAFAHAGIEGIREFVEQVWSQTLVLAQQTGLPGLLG